MNGKSNNPKESNWSEIRLLSWLHDISRRKIVNGKNLLELARYSNISLWWFVQGWIALGGNCEGRKLHSSKNFKEKILPFLRVFEPLSDLAMQAISFIICALQFNKKRRGKYKILILTCDRYWEELGSFNPNKRREGDIYFDLILRKLSQDSEIEVITSSLIGHLRNIKALLTAIKRSLNQKVIHKPFEIYWSPDISNKQAAAKKQFSKIWNDLKDNEEFRQLWNYNGNDLFPLLKGEFEHYFNHFFVRIVKYLELCNNMIEREKPDLVILISEYCGFEKAVLFSAKMKGIPTLAIQHGLICEAHIGYFNKKEDISNKINVLHRPLPDKIAIDGPWTKNLLVNQFYYPEESVAITGCTRYDYLEQVKEIFTKERFCQKYNLDLKKKIVLIAGQALLSPMYKWDEMEKQVLGVLKKMSDIEIVIKPHPNDSIDHYTKVLQNEKVNAKIIPKNSDIYEAIFSSDLLITVNSTTVSEAVILNKPVVIVNLTSEPNFLPWVEEKVALGAYNLNEIESAIQKSLFDKNVLRMMASAREKFVEDHAFKLDGKSTDRVVNVIKEMVGS